MKSIAKFFLLFIFCSAFCGRTSGQEDFMVNLKPGESLGILDYTAPEWVRDAVIVEVPVRGFNCSDYKDPSKWKYPIGDGTFSSVTKKLDFLKSMGINVLCLYSVYDCNGTNLYAIRYDNVSPDMGTMDDLKILIKEAHKRGMYIMSNTNHYGVSKEAPILTEHPDWFLPEEKLQYNQRVFDLSNPEARKYIVDVHSWWCTEIGLDGWRIDCGSEFAFKRGIWNDILKKCNDKGKKILLAPEGAHLFGNIEGGGRWGFPEILDMQNNCPRKGATRNDPYRSKEISGHNVGEPHDKIQINAFNNPAVPGPREGCYKIKGSRFLYGHNSMFAPMVPIMMTGEVINATHLGLTKSLKNHSKMLHSWIDWTDTLANKDVIDDFRKINEIRLANKDIFHFNMFETNLINVSSESVPASPVKPYVRFIAGKKAGIVIGNNSTTEDVTFKLHVPLREMGMNNTEEFYVTDSWTSETKKMKKSALENYPVLVPKDKSKGGGVRVIIIETISGNRLKRANYDFQISPYTGYTREHWLEITEQIISGVLPYLNQKTGMPELLDDPSEPAYAKVRDKNPVEERKRALERIMMAVIIYTKATGRDSVPGYHGSISAPFIKAIIHGTDPDDPAFWGDPLPNDQVGSAFALGAYINPSVFWEPISKKDKKNILNYLQKQAFNQTYDNNHYLFHMVPVALLEKNGLNANREHLTQMFQRLLDWHRGDGWFIDGNNGGFDHYNLWGFHFFFQVLDKFDSKWHDQFGDQVKKESASFFETMPYLFGRDGGPIPWGRSLTYRFAGLSSIGWAELNGNCSLPPGQARRIASGELKYFWDHGCLGENKLLNIGYWGANAAVAESYISPGDPYWATQGLACLLIPEGDPFWSQVEEPIPADGLGGTITLSGAELTIRVSPLDGEARLFPVGQPFTHGREKWQTGIKYDQYSYSSYLGFCVNGEGGPDIGAGRSGYSFDGKTWHFRERAETILVCDRHIIDKYSLGQKSIYDIITHTIIGDDGELHVFWHNYPDSIYLYLGGYGINVLSGQSLTDERNGNTIKINGGDYYSVIQSIRSPEGKFDAMRLVPREGWRYSHLFGGEGAFPFWKSSKPVPPNIPLIFYTNGTRGRRPVIGNIVVEVEGNILIIQFEGKSYTISRTPFAD